MIAGGLVFGAFAVLGAVICLFRADGRGWRPLVQTLLVLVTWILGRDGDGDGTYEEQTVFVEDLNAPYGLALVDGSLYVANQDALVRFDYRDGEVHASGPPVKVTDLPSAINHHWTKALAASPDGRLLYVGIGSNSNITERGMVAEGKAGSTVGLTAIGARMSTSSPVFSERTVRPVVGRSESPWIRAAPSSLPMTFPTPYGA